MKRKIKLFSSDLIRHYLSSFRKEAIGISLCLTFVAMSLYNFIDPAQTPLRSFERIIGVVTIANYDVNQTITRFTYLYFLWMPLLFGLFFYTISRIMDRILRQNLEEGEKVIKILNSLSLFLSFSLVFWYINKFAQTNLSIFYSFFVPCCAIISNLVYFLFNKTKEFLADGIIWSNLMGLILFFPSSVLLNKFGAETHLYYILFPLLQIITLLAYHIVYLQGKEQLFKRVQLASIPFAFTLSGVSIFLEATKVLNQYGVFVTRLRMWTMLIYVIAFMVGIILFLLCKKKEVFLNISWKKFFYFGIILSFALIAVQPPLQSAAFYSTNYAYADFFESANGAVSLSQLFQFGKIPIIESHGAHLMSDFIWGILHYLLNGNLVTSHFTPYVHYEFVLSVIIFYFILKECFQNEDFAFLTVLIFPYYRNSDIIWASISFVAVLGLFNLLKKETFQAGLLYWLSLAGAVLYKGDQGITVGLAAIAAYMLTHLVTKKKIQWKSWILSCFVIGGAFALFFMGVCYIKDINVIHRIKEFLEIMQASRLNWAYAVLLGADQVAYSFVYVLVPTLLVGLFLYFLFHQFTKKQVANSNILMIAFIFCMAFAYLFNIPRFIPRRNVAEVLAGVISISAVVFTAGLFFSLIASFFSKRQKHVAFIISLFAVMLCSKAMVSTFNFQAESLLGSTLAGFKNGSLILEGESNAIKERIVFSEPFKAEYEPVLEELDRILQPNETFVDFANKTFFYTLAGRMNPVYVNQSPGLLSGEFAQEQFIAQIEKNKEIAPIALLPKDTMLDYATHMDGVANAFRYYKVSEYISQNYIPMSTAGNYAIWCRKDRPDVYQRVMNSTQNNVIKEEQFSKLAYSDLSMVYHNGSIVMQTGSIDPIIDGFEVFTQAFNPITNTVTIGLRYASSSDGWAQLYYTTKEGEYYEEKNSQRLFAHGEGIMYFTVPYTPYSRYRFDPPSDAQFTIESILLNDEKISNYDYGDPTILHTYYIGAVPFLWGTQDTKKAYLNDILSNALTEDGALYRFDTRTIPSQKGNYLMLKLSSSTETEMEIKFGQTRGNDFYPLNTFHFKVFSGENTYLVRVSSDFYWYTDQLDSLMVVANSELVTLSDMQILLGD